MASRPFVQKSYDGTFEILLPELGDEAPHILPYCFHCAKDAADWIGSRKGRLLIAQARRQARELRKVSGAAVAAE